jgi:hypothetical protein
MNKDGIILDLMNLEIEPNGKKLSYILKDRQMNVIADLILNKYISKKEYIWNTCYKQVKDLILSLKFFSDDKVIDRLNRKADIINLNLNKSISKTYSYYSKKSQRLLDELQKQLNKKSKEIKVFDPAEFMFS